MWHPETAGDRRAMQARLESPRRFYATPGPGPGGLAPLAGGSSRRSTVMRHYPSGQPAHIRVIRRRSRLIGALPRRLRTTASLDPPPAARAAPHRWARYALGGRGRNCGEDHHSEITLDGRSSISEPTSPLTSGKSGFGQPRWRGEASNPICGRRNDVRPHQKRPPYSQTYCRIMAKSSS